MSVRSDRRGTPPLTQRDRRRGLAISTWEGMSAQSHSVLTGLGVGANALTTGFGLMLGAGDAELSLLAAVPPLAGLFQLAAAATVGRLANRRIPVAIVSTLARVMWLVCGLLPFVVTSRRDALWAFIALWMTSSALIAMCGNWWISWMADLCPGAARPRYFAWRTAALTAASLVVGLASGLALDRWFGGVPRVAVAGPDPLYTLRATGFALVFGLATLLGLICGVLLWFQPEPHRTAASRAARASPGSFLAGSIAAARASPGFAGLLAFVGAFGLSNGMAAPFWQPFQLEQLGLSYAYVNGVLVTVSGVAAIAALPAWGAISVRFGHRVSLIVAIAIIATHPVYFLIATPDRTWPMILDAASSGLAWSGYNLAMFNLVLARAAGPARDRLVALHTAVAGVAQATSSVIAGRVIATLPATFALAGADLVPRQQIFAVTTLARIACLGLFLVVIRYLPPSIPRVVRVGIEGVSPTLRTRLVQWASGLTVRLRR